MLPAFYMRFAFVLQAYVLWLGFCVLASAAHALALHLAQVPVRAFRLFAGASLTSVRLGGIALEFGWVPVGTSVLYDVPTLYLRPMWMRVGVTLVGPLAAWHQFLAGFVQLPLGALHPLSVALELIARLHATFLTSVPAAAGILAAKLAAMELLAARRDGHGAGDLGTRRPRRPGRRPDPGRVVPERSTPSS